MYMNQEQNSENSSNQFEKAEEKQQQNKKYQLVIQNTEYINEKLRELCYQNEGEEDECNMPMRSCRHIYVAHKIRIFQIENGLIQNPQHSS